MVIKHEQVFLFFQERDEGGKKTQLFILLFLFILKHAKWFILILMIYISDSIA